MANTKKLTKRDYFNKLLGLDEVRKDKDLIEFINHELDLLARKNSTERKPTAEQIANENLKDVIYNVLKASATMMTITEMQKANEELADFSNQKLSALIRQMKDDGKVEKIEDKRKSYFKAI